MDNETNNKIEELERQVKQIKGTDSLGSVNLNYLCIHAGLKFRPSSSVRKIQGESCLYTHLKVYGVVMAQYSDNDKLLVLTFSRSLTGAALTWFTKLNIVKIKKWTDLAHVSINNTRLIQR